MAKHKAAYVSTKNLLFHQLLNCSTTEGLEASIIEINRDDRVCGSAGCTSGRAADAARLLWQERFRCERDDRAVPAGLAGAARPCQARAGELGGKGSHSAG